MSSTQIARAYAEALLDVADDQGNLGRVVEDLHAVRKLVDEEETFRLFFWSPRLDREEKKRIVDRVFREELCRPVLGLLHVLIEKRREPVFDNIVDEFARFRDLREGRIHAEVTSARPLEEEWKQEIASRLARATGKQVDIRERVDPRLIGGLVVKLGDRIIDGSVRRRLEKLRRALAAGE